jgi:hypothetical protein
VKRSRLITATELADCCVCEQRVMFDRLRGKRRTSACRRRMRAGTAGHAELHRQAMGKLAVGGHDARCFVATALWGEADPRTQALREWRNTWLLKRLWGSAATRLYYRVSPLLVVAAARAPWLKAFLDVVLSAFVGRVAKRLE